MGRTATNLNPRYAIDTVTPGVKAIFTRHNLYQTRIVTLHILIPALCFVTIFNTPLYH